MKFNKLVRDKIPEIIKRNGDAPITHIANDEEFSAKIKEKLQEEVDEFLKEPDAEELADVLEVIYALSDYLGVSKEDLESIRKEKADKRGRFKERIILDETNEFFYRIYLSMYDCHHLLCMMLLS